MRRGWGGRQGRAGGFWVGGHLGISPSAPSAGTIWAPGGPHGCLSADVAGCRLGASLLCLLVVTAVPGRDSGPAALREVWEEEAEEDAEPMLRDFCMLKRDGISANMASMESTLWREKFLHQDPRSTEYMQRAGKIMSELGKM